MEKLNVIFYERESGRIPAMDFLQSLNSTDAKKVDEVINELGKNTHYLSPPYSKPLKNINGLFELRVQGIDKTQLRLLYFYGKNHDIIITHGFIKKEQDVPEKEKKRAKTYYNDWCRRSKKMQKSR